MNTIILLVCAVIWIYVIWQSVKDYKDSKINKCFRCYKVLHNEYEHSCQECKQQIIEEIDEEDRESRLDRNAVQAYIYAVETYFEDVVDQDAFLAIVTKKQTELNDE